jgi:hypothetical protein
VLKAEALIPGRVPERAPAAEELWSGAQALPDRQVNAIPLVARGRAGATSGSVRPGDLNVTTPSLPALAAQRHTRACACFGASTARTWTVQLTVLRVSLAHDSLRLAEQVLIDRRHTVVQRH